MKNKNRRRSWSVAIQTSLERRRSELNCMSGWLVQCTVSVTLQDFIYRLSEGCIGVICVGGCCAKYRNPFYLFLGRLQFSIEDGWRLPDIIVKISFGSATQIHYLRQELGWFEHGRTYSCEMLLLGCFWKKIAVLHSCALMKSFGVLRLFMIAMNAMIEITSLGSKTCVFICDLIFFTILDM